MGKTLQQASPVFHLSEFQESLYTFKFLDLRQLFFMKILRYFFFTYDFHQNLKFEIPRAIVSTQFLQQEILDYKACLLVTLFDLYQHVRQPCVLCSCFAVTSYTPFKTPSTNFSWKTPKSTKPKKANTGRNSSLFLLSFASNSVLQFDFLPLILCKSQDFRQPIVLVLKVFWKIYSHLTPARRILRRTESDLLKFCLRCTTLRCLIIRYYLLI